MSKVRTAVLSSLGLLAVAGLGGCNTVDGHVTWQPSGVPHHDHPYQQWWNYKFLYFPEQQVYYEPYTGEFFWYDDGQWEQGQQLPSDMRIEPDEAQVVKLQHQKPYVQHETVLKWSWPHNHAAPGALDAVHQTGEAFALSEKRQVWRESGVSGEQDWWNAQWSEADTSSMDPVEDDMDDLVGSVDADSSETND